MSKKQRRAIDREAELLLGNGDPSVSELRSFSASQRESIREKRSRDIRNRLRGLHIGAGILCLVAAIVAWVIIYAFGISTNEYVVCTYALRAIPAIVLPSLVSFGCFSAFLAVTIWIAMYGLIYHLVVINVFFREYVTGLAGGNYNNRFRWIFRGATVPLYYMIAVHVSGARSGPALFILVMLAVVVEVLRWVGERQTAYRVRGPSVLAQSGCATTTYDVVVKRTGKVALAMAFFLSIFLTGVQLVYWAMFLLEDFANVPLITWFYGIGFVVYYLIFAIWAHVVMSADELVMGQRINTEYAWIIYDAIGLIILTGLIVVGTILP